MFDTSQPFKNVIYLRTGIFRGNQKEFKAIGLSNVYSRVNMMSGQIDVESTETAGTLINIEVPKKVE